jgi:hypothetical protein
MTGALAACDAPKRTPHPEPTASGDSSSHKGAGEDSFVWPASEPDERTDSPSFKSQPSEPSFERSFDSYSSEVSGASYFTSRWLPDGMLTGDSYTQRAAVISSADDGSPARDASSVLGLAGVGSIFGEQDNSATDSSSPGASARRDRLSGGSPQAFAPPTISRLGLGDRQPTATQNARQ